MKHPVRRDDTRRRVPLLAMSALALACMGATSLPDRGSQADQEACTPDVFRLCGDFIPDEPRILACLKGKHDQLSPACGAVIAPDPVQHHRKRSRS